MRQVSVNRQRVLDFIRYELFPVDTAFISKALSKKGSEIPERSVRAAVVWLILGGYLEKLPKTEIRKTKNGENYRVWLYRPTGKVAAIERGSVRRDPEEREILAQQDKYKGGVFLQELFLNMKGRK